ncbi:MAG: YggS family pyridoxal phosphate-dependent enzyme [Saprospiraceae bacterium]|nr:YggS family pyridoxal phosphate-dependent enzyme [Saprospiraceae bacterium]
MKVIWQAIQDELSPFGAQLIAVSKTKPVEEIRQLYDLGQRAFGENRVQEVLDKAPRLPDDIKWHLIGHLQRNKVRSVLPIAHTIHSVDSLRLYKEILKQAEHLDLKVRMLLQMKIATEDTKYGLDLSEALEIIERWTKESDRIDIAGLMGMATFTDDKAQVRMEFRKLRTMRDQLVSAFPDRSDFLTTLSMGMSGDYRIALEEGSTMVRIGSMLFGMR